MRRIAFSACALLACALAGAFAAFVLASEVGAQLLTGSTSTGTTTGTTTTNPTPPAFIPPGVTISGIAVGGLSPEEAVALIQTRFELPLRLVVDRRRRLAPSPYDLGAEVDVPPVVERARISSPGTALQLPVGIDGGTLRAYVLTVAHRFDRPARDAKVFLRHLRPVVVPDHAGSVVLRDPLMRLIVKRLRAHSRVAVRIRRKALSATIKRSEFRSVIVIRRGSNRLLLYHFARLRRSFRVATGQSVYPTPLGRFEIAVKWRNPWWYPPNSRWARGQQPIPPGPNNPLGTRWMGLTAPGVGIHGTPNAGSIGYSVSHGCIRMYIPDAEWLFRVVDIGTTVFIVSG